MLFNRSHYTPRVGARPRLTAPATIAEPGDTMFRTLLLATDGSENARRATEPRSSPRPASPFPCQSLVTTSLGTASSGVRRWSGGPGRHALFRGRGAADGQTDPRPPRRGEYPPRLRSALGDPAASDPRDRGEGVGGPYRPREPRARRALGAGHGQRQPEARRPRSMPGPDRQIGGRSLYPDVVISVGRDPDATHSTLPPENHNHYIHVVSMYSYRASAVCIGKDDAVARRCCAGTITVGWRRIIRACTEDRTADRQRHDGNPSDPLADSMDAAPD